MNYFNCSIFKNRLFSQGLFKINKLVERLVHFDTLFIKETIDFCS